MTSEELAWKIRRHAIEMTHLSGGSHISSALSVTDILAVLYTNVLHVNSENPNWEDRDRFIMSKGHAGLALYAALAECGFFEIDELKTYYQDGSRLLGHASFDVPGVDWSTGSLGHGLSVAAGIAYNAKKSGKQYRVYAVLGDGECDEGSIWESLLFANHFRLNNLVAIVDHNHMQSLDYNENTLELDSLAEKWKAFGWHVIETNGNDHNSLKSAFLKADQLLCDLNHRPVVIIANTIKGYGVSFMENDILWHYRFPHDGWEYDCAVNELHQTKPQSVVDIYTPNGIKNPASPNNTDDIDDDHTLSSSWNPSYPEKMRRIGKQLDVGQSETES